jgi:hypothetical protein
MPEGLRLPFDLDIILRPDHSSSGVLILRSSAGIVHPQRSPYVSFACAVTAGTGWRLINAILLIPVVSSDRQVEPYLQ